MKGGDVNSIERQMKALANRRRLVILRFLKGRKEASVGDIADSIKLSFKATSKHLGILYAAGVLEKEQESLVVSYRISPGLHPAARDVIDLL